MNRQDLIEPATGSIQPAQSEKGLGSAPTTTPSRRAFLKGFGAATLASAAGAVTAAASSAMPDVISDLHSSKLNLNARRGKAYQNRMKAAALDRKTKTAPLTNNGDEAKYSNGIANFSKGFTHDNNGIVDPTQYAAYLAAIATGKRTDFDGLKLGGNTPLIDPQAGLAFDLETCDPTQNSIPAFDTLTSPGLAAQMIETYWMALTRDVPFSQWGSDPTIAAACTELSALAAFAGPRSSGGLVTPQTLFRGLSKDSNGNGESVGPYISQFFLQPFGVGVMPFQGYTSVVGGVDYGTTQSKWLALQNGQGPFGTATASSSLRYLGTGRDLAEYVHNDVLYQEYLIAALAIARMASQFSIPVFNSGNPYVSLTSETGFITFGLPMVQALMGEVAVRALKNAWYQKWFVHRMARPEETAGLVNGVLLGGQTYPLDASLLSSAATMQIFARNGNYFLPLSYPEGCPLHPSYPSGHATVAGAAVTVLKWFFNDSLVIPNPLTTTDDGSSTTAYTGSDAGLMTIGSELNKLASNVGFGRIFSGIHWRNDAWQGMLLGEAVAINLLRDQAHLYNENYTGFSFTKFDGTKVTV